jgi:hypothetical protein
MIKEIGKFKRPREDLIERRKETLARWLSFGHSEAEIRRLVALDETPLAEMTTTPTKRGK